MLIQNREKRGEDGGDECQESGHVTSLYRFRNDLIDDLLIGCSWERRYNFSKENSIRTSSRRRTKPMFSILPREQLPLHRRVKMIFWARDISRENCMK